MLQAAINIFVKSSMNTEENQANFRKNTPPFLHSFDHPSWGAIWSYQPHLEVMDPIWWLVTQPSSMVSWLRFFGIFLTRRSVLSPGIISLSSLSLANRLDLHGTRGKWALITWTGAGGTATFWPQSMAPWTTDWPIFRTHWETLLLHIQLLPSGLMS